MVKFYRRWGQWQEVVDRRYRVNSISLFSSISSVFCYSYRSTVERQDWPDILVYIISSSTGENDIIPSGFDFNVMLNEKMKNGACLVWNLNLQLTAVTICLSIIHRTDISSKDRERRNHLCTRVHINVNEWEEEKDTLPPSHPFDWILNQDYWQTEIVINC